MSKILNHKFLNDEAISEIEEMIDEPYIYRNDEYMDLIDNLHSLGRETLKQTLKPT